ncbi:MFS transporter [Saccharopolyspora sp. K220]|uniref:MFS transporter n=1 Tax=Saccharopolyspora soli TaxID=2926618 RepID=UPI001F59F95C|nr:MFS transporter [Saccharopolyspora soli]MCI2424175.1 MFS transporter [Saccharopolyspora soli]
MSMSAAGLSRAAFSRYWLSAFLADFGDGVRLAAFPLLALQVTNSPAAVAAVTAVQGLPWILIGLGAGAIVDRHDLRATMVMVDVIRAVVIAALALAVAGGALSLPLIYLTAFATGVGALVRDTAAATAVPRLVGEDELERANGRLVAGRLVGDELAGPAVGGWLFGIAAALPFALNAGGLGLSILLLLTLPSIFAAPRRPREPAGLLRSTVRDLNVGLAWLRRDRLVRNLVVAVALVAVADGAFLAILVLYVTQVLDQSAAVYGLLLGLGAIGGIVAGVSCARLTSRIGAARMLTTTVITMAVAQLALGLTSSMVVTSVTLVCSGGAFAAFNVTSMTVRQRRSPIDMLGRVNSTYLTVGRSAAAIGALAGGALAAAAGIHAPILIGVIPLLCAAVLIARTNPQQRPFA